MRRWTNKKINLRTPIFQKKKKKLFSGFRTVICVFYLLRHELHLFAEVVFVTLLADDLTIILLIKVILFPEKLNFFKRLWCFALSQCASDWTVEQTKQHCLESMDPGFFVFGRNKQNDGGWVYTGLGLFGGLFHTLLILWSPSISNSKKYLARPTARP